MKILKHNEYARDFNGKHTYSNEIKKYDVHVGKSVVKLNNDRSKYGPAVSNVMIISDEAVASLHLQTVIDALQVEATRVFVCCTKWRKRSLSKISMRLIRQLLKIN